MGAKVMHPLSIKPCFDKNIPIYVKNTFNHTSDGTKITSINESENYKIEIIKKFKTRKTKNQFKKKENKMQK